jgi:hypothetical protein
MRHEAWAGDHRAGQGHGLSRALPSGSSAAHGGAQAPFVIGGDEDHPSQGPYLSEQDLRQGLVAMQSGKPEKDQSPYRVEKERGGEQESVEQKTRGEQTHGRVHRGSRLGISLSIPSGLIHPRSHSRSHSPKRSMTSQQGQGSTLGLLGALALRGATAVPDLGLTGLGLRVHRDPRYLGDPGDLGDPSASSALSSSGTHRDPSSPSSPRPSGTHRDPSSLSSSGTHRDPSSPSSSGTQMLPQSQSASPVLHNDTGPRGTWQTRQELDCLGETEEAWLFHGDAVVEHLSVLKSDVPGRVVRAVVTVDLWVEPDSR